jgi:hypothetical protein
LDIPEVDATPSSRSLEAAMAPLLLASPFEPENQKKSLSLFERFVYSLELLVAEVVGYWSGVNVRDS